MFTSFGPIRSRKYSIVPSPISESPPLLNNRVIHGPLKTIKGKHMTNYGGVNSSQTDRPGANSKN